MTALVTDGLDWWARTAPDRPAIVFAGADAVDYRTLATWTDHAAHRLAERGIGPGDRVGMIGANSLEWCAAALGALKLGAVVVPYNNRFVPAELAHLLADSAPALVLADEPHRERMAEALAGLPGAAAEPHGRAPEAAARPTGAAAGAAAPPDRIAPELAGLEPFAELRLLAPKPPRPRPDRAPDDLAVLVYTSGTTSSPKGVGFTHRTTGAFIAEWGCMEPALRAGGRMIYVLSMSGAPGLLWHVLHPLTRGMTLFYERGFDPAVTLRRLAEERVQVMMGVPLLFEQMAARPEFADADLSALEFASVAGARVPVPTLRAWLAKGVRLRQGYGMTELGGLSTVNPADEAERRPESVGRDGMFTRHRVIRPDGTDCAPGEPGEIVVSGPAVTPGYWRNPEATSAALRDGWFYSGDVGIRDEDGFLRVVDRMKDLIISGGFNIAPSEVEAVIAEVPGVAEVCVIAVPDAKFGEAAAAVVHPEAPVTEDRVLEECRRRLAGFKVPRAVLFTDRPLPRMASGKVARRELHARFGGV